MKTIYSWNVNGIRAVCKKGFIEWLSGNDIDVLCVQETKARKEQLPEEILNIPAGKESGNFYHCYFASAKKAGYSGVAIYTRDEPRSVSVMGIPEFDDEGRFLSADFGDYSVISAYFPNSQDGGARLPYKLDFCSAIKEHCRKLRDEGKNYILCGDYNIAHKPIDLKNPEANKKNPGYLPEERAWMDGFLSDENIDTFRFFCKEPEQYTWWSYRFNAREKNIGWRIDYQCVNESFMGAVKESRILQSVTGSDHCPVMISLEG